MNIGELPTQELSLGKMDCGFRLSEIGTDARKQMLSHAAGVYVLTQTGKTFLVRRTPSGREVRSEQLYIGCSRDLLRRLQTWARSGTKNEPLNRFIERHGVDRIRVRVYLCEDYEAAREWESRGLLKHVAMTRRLPAFNRASEFMRACRSLGYCLSPKHRQEALRPWLHTPR